MKSLNLLKTTGSAKLGIKLWIRIVWQTPGTCRIVYKPWPCCHLKSETYQIDLGDNNGLLRGVFNRDQGTPAMPVLITKLSFIFELFYRYRKASKMSKPGLASLRIAQSLAIALSQSFLLAAASWNTKNFKTLGCMHKPSNCFRVWAIAQTIAIAQS